MLKQQNSNVLLPLIMETPESKEISWFNNSPVMVTEKYYKGIDIFNALKNNGLYIGEKNSALVKKYVSQDNRNKTSEGTWVLNSKGVNEYLSKFNMHTIKGVGDTLVIKNNTYQNKNLKIK